MQGRPLTGLKRDKNRDSHMGIHAAVFVDIKRHCLLECAEWRLGDGLVQNVLATTPASSGATSVIAAGRK